MAQIVQIRTGALGEDPPDPGAFLGFSSTELRRLGVQTAGLAGVTAGGALTGYLAAETGRGAAIGALVHLSLYGLASGIWGEFSTQGRLLFGFLGIASGLGAGYLFLSKGRRGR